MNNLVVFLNDTRRLRGDLLYSSCVHTHNDTTKQIKALLTSDKRKTQFVYTTDITALGYYLIDKDRYNCNIYGIAFFNKNTGEMVSRGDPYCHPKDVLLRVICFAKNNEIVQCTDKELRYAHNLFRLYIGGHFDTALKNSKYKMPYNIRRKSKLINKLYSWYGKNG